HVLPFPGTPDASPQSQVVFSSLQPSELRSVLVVGSSTGLHRGHLIGLPDGAGTAFVPRARFADGERVRVTAMLSSSRAGTASGTRGARQLSFAFTVRRPLGDSAVSPGAIPATMDNRPPDRRGRVGFHSQPDLYPPQMTVRPDRDRSSGDIFLTPHNGGQNGPMILNSKGQLVWFPPLGGKG